MSSTEETINRPDRIAIIGCGHVGATSAYSLIQRGVAREVVIVDSDARRAEGEAMDLRHAVPLSRPVRVWGGSYEEAAQAAIVVIAAGAGGRPGESRLDLLGRNVVVVREILKRMAEAGFDGIVLMTTNPVDILAQVAQEESGLPSARVIGSGTVLDTARLRAMLGDALGLEAR
ncbi:MAG TPA: NAD(P)-binding domain-containing protein [Pyrinomonadaceae bacterium]|nr:NAD(P)-binding domain-containing protein [Pyrinomonadaceae bacterium]